MNEYLRCLNASEAARLAGYSAKTAAAIGFENLRKPKIREEIERRLEDAGMSPAEVVARLSDMARADMTDFIDPTEGGEDFTFNFKRAKEAGALRHVKKIRVGAKGEIGLELHDAGRALAKLADVWQLVKAENDDGDDLEGDEEAILAAAEQIRRRRAGAGDGGTAPPPEA